jgi:hypothetical protein
MYKLRQSEGDNETKGLCPRRLSERYCDRQSLGAVEDNGLAKLKVHCRIVSNQIKKN